jgi:2-amino-4-hydroxy-6-hydroxymethyldihydropteridine diphosphokinase
VRGRWGEPRATLLRACRELEAAGVEIVRRSNCYVTVPVGGGRQPRYLNAVITVRSGTAPGALLRLAKSIERRAGRQLAPRMAARPLDIDILDYGGRRTGHPGGRRRYGQLILPHPEMHKRAFVLRPLQDVAPHWQHPVVGRPVKALLAHLDPAERAGVTLDSAGNSCNKGRS